MLSISKYLRASEHDELPSKALRRFYEHIVLSNGTHRTTNSNRLSEVDSAFIRIWPKDRPLRRILDVGVSSGITTADWAASLARENLRPEIIATDRIVYVKSVRLLGGLLAHVEAKTGHLLQIELFGLGIRAFCRPRDFITGAFLWRAPLIAAATHACRSREASEPPVAFVASEIRGRPNIAVCEADILLDPVPALTGMDAIRVANLMQPIYFSESELRLIAKNTRACCAGPGSIVILCRDLGREIEASFLRLNPNGTFSVLSRIGTGSIAEEYFTTIEETQAR